MKTKQLLILVGVFVGLFLIVLILENPFGKSSAEKKDEAVKPLFPDFKKGDVVKIEITASGKTATLVKENDQWLVASMDDYPADQEGVNDLLDKVEEFDTRQPVSKNPEKQSVFQVDSSGAEAKLLAAGDQLVAHVFVGKTTPDFLSSYVRVADSNNVYVANGYLKSTFDKADRSWRDRTIFEFNSGDVTQLSIKSETEEIALQLSDDGNWQMLKPVASGGKKTEIDSLLGTLSSLKTDDFAEQKELKEYELDAPKSSLSVTLNDGSTRVLLIGKEESGKHYVKRAAKDQVFMLFKSRINQLIKKSEDLKDATSIVTGDTGELEEDVADEGE